MPPLFDMTQATSTGRYEVTRELRAGALSLTALGQVVAGPHEGRRCILKTAREDGEHREMARATIAREGALLERLSHPLVVRAFEVQVEGPAPFVALEYVEGVNLTELMVRARTEGGIPTAVALALIAQLFEGLSYVHTAADAAGRPLRIRHCDITPSNLMVTWSGDLKLLDFGVSQWREDPDRFDRQVSVGTPGYMAPEQVSAGPSTDRVDVFAAALVGLVMLGARRSPFTRRTVDATLRATALNERRPVAQMLPRAPAEIAALFEQALASKPSARPSASGFAMELLERLHRTELRVATREEVQSFLRPLSQANRERTDSSVSVSAFTAPGSLPNVTVDLPEASEDDVICVEDPDEALSSLLDRGVEAVLSKNLGAAYACFRDAAEIAPEHPQVRANLQRLEELGVRAVA